MKQHRFWAWAAVICMAMALLTGYQKNDLVFDYCLRRSFS